ncbi:MAG: FAD-dependent thymidylate synthase [Clostridium sp.]|uniref:FAD-dependent thymidylate synthase n=1 Tax=Clostridium sp. TaxID=1506 RepID=UPI003EE44B65
MIKITDYTKNPMNMMGKSAGYCYNTTNEKWFKRIAEQCLKEGHHRVAEFPDIHFEFSEFSGKVMREIFRHIHLTGLQESTRYVDMEDFKYQTPPSILKNKEAKEVWDKGMTQISNTVKGMKELGVPVEDFSNIIPLAYNTKGVMKIGLRELMHIFNVRACTCAYHEARKFCMELKKAIKETKDEQWIWIAENYLVPKCDIKMFCEEEKRWHLCKRHPTKSQVKELIDEFKTSNDWRK